MKRTFIALAAVAFLAAFAVSLGVYREWRVQKWHATPGYREVQVRKHFAVLWRGQQWVWEQAQSWPSSERGQTEPELKPFARELDKERGEFTAVCRECATAATCAEALREMEANPDAALELAESQTVCPYAP